MAESERLMVLVNHELQFTPAVARALALARKSGDPILLASFEFDRVLARAAQRGTDLEAYKQGRHQKLEVLAESLRHDGVKVDTRVYWGHPIAAYRLLMILIEQPLMVIKDVNEESRAQQLLFTPEDLDLLRECPAPLMLVRSSARALPRSILAAVDPLDEHNRPHELNSHVLKIANRLAMQCSAQLDVVHAFEYIPPPMDPSGVGWMPDFNLPEELRGLHLEELKKLAAEFGVPASRLHMLDGRPARVIAEFAAAHGADLVVMGTVQRNFLQRLALGSVAEGLLQHLDCDVLALKPAGFDERLKPELEKTNFGDDLT
ncbi:MAG: universal stress protein [Gammaproteobacteria bacterium]